jgi:hypothetical protein
MVAKRTQRDDEDCIELRKLLTVEAEALQTAAGNMCGTVLRGTAAPPESETSSSRQGSCRNLGDLRPPAAAVAVPGLGGKLDWAEPLRKAGGVGRLRSTDEASNKAGPGSAAETVEGRRPVGGKASRDACPGPSAGTGMSPRRRACGPGREGPTKPPTPVAFDLRQEPGAGKPHAGICAGGGP